MPISVVRVPHDGGRKLFHTGEPDGSQATVVTTKYAFVVEHTGLTRDGQRKFSPVEETLPKRVLEDFTHQRNLIAHEIQSSYRAQIEYVRSAYESDVQLAKTIRGGAELTEAVARLAEERDKLVDQAFNQPAVFGRIAIDHPVKLILLAGTWDMGTVLTLTPHSPR